MQATPTLFVLFGSTGDLSRLKLLPALNDLWFENILPGKFKLIAVGRREMTTEEYLEELATEESHPFRKQIDFLNPEYVQVDFKSQDGFDPLWNTLQQYKGHNIIYYMAVGPKVLNMSVDRFEDESSKSVMKGRNGVFLAEKPFGESQEDASQLNIRLGKLFTPRFVYRNDHYLKKDTVQAIGNLIETDIHLSQILNNESLKGIDLVVSEEVDLGSRASYFEKRGMLVDWFQSHMLQLLATLCGDMHLENHHLAKTEFIESLEIVPGSLIRAQYEGYRDLDDVDSDSSTDTFLAIQLHSNLPRWKGILFKMIAGKGMAKKEVLFKLKMREPHHIFGDQLKLLIDPPGGNPIMEPSVKDEFEETVLDLIHEREEKFVSAQEVEAQWKVTEMIQNILNSEELQFYPKGSSYGGFCNMQHLWCEDPDEPNQHLGTS